MFSQIIVIALFIIADFWDSSTESLSMGKTAVQSGGEGKGNGDPFCSGEDISKCSSVNHLEQYM